MRIPDNVTNPKTLRRWQKMLDEYKEKSSQAAKLGYVPETRLKAGRNSVYSYKGSVYGFDTEWEAMLHFLENYPNIY
jgi:hypothetical protein